MEKVADRVLDRVFAHEMLREIYEQPEAIRRTLELYVVQGEEGVELNSVSARHIEENVRQLIELTSGVEKASGATARLLWSELGESLAQRLAARLGVGN